MNESIKCPNCGTIIDISQAFANKIKAEHELKFKAEVEKHRAEYKKYRDELVKKESEFDEKLKNSLNLELEKEKAKLEDSLKQEKIKLNESLKNQKETIKKELEKESSSIIESLKKSLDEMSEKNILANKQLLEFENLKREKAQLESKFELEYAKKLNDSLKANSEVLKKQIFEENELKLKEKDIELERLKKNIDELKNAAQNRSQQLQGEAQELAIEEFLKTKFPFDSIEEIKKGANGADCTQVINTQTRPNCGKIYYESKRTKSFSPGWIEKFKADMREKGADIGILVTQTLPSDISGVGLVDGVWVCGFSEFKLICEALRQSIIEINFAKNVSENRHGKMELLYSYLTSNDFKLQLEAVVEAFSSLQTELEREKNAMARIWKSREKQIEKAKDSAISMFGSIKGIAGNEIGEIKTLELEYIEDES
ncbi:DUF2130 domain-containing protein [Campylobacter geochelonis]|uniref:DUF2130 domain-containing protein n=1 Tax=Campylobacter geochelonis TaxID=1780362 RepID=UPI000770A6BC|nr:DUF2130 domain-containing protein [Campylobacter geochelonis]CZE48475.1 Uncharacterized protein conserved in bacteria [Campylobacter geochelonis]